MQTKLHFTAFNLVRLHFKVLQERLLLKTFYRKINTNTLQMIMDMLRCFFFLFCPQPKALRLTCWQ